MLRILQIFVCLSPEIVEYSQDLHAQKNAAIHSKEIACCLDVMEFLCINLKNDGVNAFCCLIAGSFLL